MRLQYSLFIALVLGLSACVDRDQHNASTQDASPTAAESPVLPNSTETTERYRQAYKAPLNREADKDKPSVAKTMAPSTKIAPLAAEPGVGQMVLTHPLDNATPIALSGVTYQVNTTQAQTTASGQFEYGAATQVQFKLLGQTIGPVPAKAQLTEADLAAAVCTRYAFIAQCEYRAAYNLRRFLLNADSDADPSNGITPIPALQQGVAPWLLTAPVDQFDRHLQQIFARAGATLVPTFKPSVGINTEAPQPEADEIGGQAVPFVDLFRIARPFSEYSCTDITYDEQGWPTSIPASCDTQNHAVLKVPSWATTFILRYLPALAIPTGRYTVLYEGAGELQYSGIARKDVAASTQGRDVIIISPALMQAQKNSGIRLQLKSTDPLNPVRNIRVVMPGGTCEGNPFVRVESAAGCPAGAYRSFAERLALDRNAIIFNPDYLRFLKDFKVVRLMNLLETSPRNPCYDYSDEAYTQCLLQDFAWEQRAKMDAASWGGSSRTPLIQRYARGVPLEVAVELVNQLGRDPWFNIPHNATDDYINQYATYVRDHLRSDLKVHLEYSNEPWNSIFWSALYVREKGKALDSNPYRAGYKYYSSRAVQIFQQWETLFGGTDRLVRILNTFNQDEWMTRNMLSYNANYQYVDAVASAPYFYGCWDRTHSACTETNVPTVIKDTSSVDQLFTIMDNENDPYGVSSTIKLIQKQVQAVHEFGVDFYTYEGGQHLTITWTDETVSTEQKNTVLELIRGANRDARMGERYTQLLQGWEEAGGDLFMFYTMPQTYHRFGTFGIKEYLTQPRSAAPKYDSIMRYQEQKQPCTTALDC